MLDRASTFAHLEIVTLLQTQFVPVALDQAYQRRQKDTEGEFYRQIASQSPRNNCEQTTQGFYVATAAGHLLLFNNNCAPEKLLQLLTKSVTEFDANSRDAVVPTPRNAETNSSVPSGHAVDQPEAQEHRLRV